MSTFKPRLTRPEKGNPYYNTKSNGGYSSAVKGNSIYRDRDCDVLPNCVGYAYGRFNEIGGYGYCKYLSPVNAEKFIQYKGSLEDGLTPRVGACMVWQGGASLSGRDGAGHVAIVEMLISDTEILVSQSGWYSEIPFWTATIKKVKGNWYIGDNYTFLGFIYNPAECCKDTLPNSTPTTSVKPAPDIHAGIDFTGLKYSGSNLPEYCLQSDSSCYKGTTKMDIKGIVVHTTKTSENSIKTFIQPSDSITDGEAILKKLGTNSNKTDWNHCASSECFHAVIGKLEDGSVTTVQALPWNYRAWGCGTGTSGTCNDGWIQILLCEDSAHDKTYFEAVYSELCDIVAYLCRLFGLNPRNYTTCSTVKVPILLTHSDAYLLKVASSAQDTVTWFSKFGKSASSLRNTVAQILNIPCTHKDEQGVSTVKVFDAVPATCVENGYTGDTICIQCNEVLQHGEVLTKIPHDLDWRGICKDCRFIDDSFVFEELVSRNDLYAIRKLLKSMIDRNS